MNPTRQLSALLLSGKHYRLPKGQVLQISDEHMTLNLLKKGYVKRYSITSQGAQSIQVIYGPGDIFPLTAAFRALLNKNIYRGAEVFYYETLVPSDIYSLNKTALQTAAAKDPILYKDLLDVAGDRLSSNIQRLENVSLRSAYQQTAHQLVYLAEKFGQPAAEGLKIMVPLTHQNFAGVLNLARETVTNCLNRLRQKGLISGDQNIVVTDIEKLRREVR